MASRSLLHDAIANLLVRGFSVLASFALTATLAQVLGVSEFGRYSLVIAIVTVLAIPAQAGVPELVLRETAKAHHAENWARMRGVWAWSTRIVIGSSAAIAVCALLVLMATHWRPAAMDTSTIIVALLFVPLVALGSIRGSILRGLGRVVAGLLPEYLIRPLAALMAVLLAVSWTNTLTAEEAIYLYILAAAVAFILGVALLWFLRPSEINKETQKEIDGSQWRKSAVVLALMAGMTVLLQQVDILMLGMFATDEQVGLYRVAAQCSLVVSFGLTATLSAVAPHIIRAHSAGDPARVRLLVVYSARLTTALSLVPLAAFALAGEELLRLVFGAEFSAAMPPLMGLALSQAVVAVVGPVSVLLVMTGHERVSARIMAIALGLNVLGNLLLIPPFGAIGAALGTGIAIIVQHVLLSLAVKERLGFFGAAFAPAKVRVDI